MTHIEDKMKALRIDYIEVNYGQLQSIVKKIDLFSILTNYLYINFMIISILAVHY